MTSKPRWSNSAKSRKTSKRRAPHRPKRPASRPTEHLRKHSYCVETRMDTGFEGDAKRESVSAGGRRSEGKLVPLTISRPLDLPLLLAHALHNAAMQPVRLRKS